MSQFKIFIVVGPTAIGKTKYAIELAKKENAEIINADSVQVYKKLNIGSAKPTEDELKEVPHHLVDYVEPDVQYNVKKFQTDARLKIAELKKRNKNVVIVGGTGLYIKALLYNYEFDDNDEYEQVRKQMELLTPEQIKILAQEHQIEEVNPQRLITKLAKKILNLKNSDLGNEKYYQDFTIIGLTGPREMVYNRINKRVDQMFEEGLVEEVKQFSSELPSQKTIGYKETHQYLKNEISLEEARELIKRNSRRLAKKQYTWFNNKIDVTWINILEEE